MNYRHIEGVTVSAVFTKDHRYRYRLEITKADATTSGKTVCLVMQNPSCADEKIADRSVKFMEQLIFGNKHSSFKNIRRLIVVNQFALVQTSDFEGNDEDVGRDNDKEIEKALRESEIVVLGWGSSNPFDVRKCVVFGLLKNMLGKKIYKTRVHPSRASQNDTEFIQPFAL